MDPLRRLSLPPLSSHRTWRWLRKDLSIPFPRCMGDDSADFALASLSNLCDTCMYTKAHPSQFMFNSIINTIQNIRR